MTRKEHTEAGTKHPTFGKNLRWFRKLRGLTGEQLADFASTSKGYVSSLENGKANPSYPTACAMADALGIPVSWLWDHHEPPRDPPPEPARPEA